MVRGDRRGSVARAGASAKNLSPCATWRSQLRLWCRLWANAEPSARRSVSRAECRARTPRARSSPAACAAASAPETVRSFEQCGPIAKRATARWRAVQTRKLRETCSSPSAAYTSSDVKVDHLRRNRDAIRWTGAGASVECVVQHPGRARIAWRMRRNPRWARLRARSLLLTRNPSARPRVGDYVASLPRGRRSSFAHRSASESTRV